MSKQKITLWGINNCSGEGVELYYFATNHRDTAQEHAMSYAKEKLGGRAVSAVEVGFVKIDKKYIGPQIRDLLEYGGAIICNGGLETVAMR